MNKTCKQCQTEFEITKEDLEFYKKISPAFTGKVFEIPVPNLCPECRLMRRMVWRNERKLYKNNCSLCHKDIISVYSPDKKYKLLCSDCYWSDRWDQYHSGRDYDFDNKFFKQFADLLKDSYLVNLYSTNCENSEFVNQEMNSSNCYLCTGGNDNRECYYLESCIHCTNTVDCYGVGFSEKVYGSVFCTACFSSRYLYNCHMCHDCYFCDDCTGCDYCFGSKNLRYKKYYFFNEKFSKEEYLEKVKEYLSGLENVNNVEKEFEQHKLKLPVKFMLTISCTDDCTGDVLMNCKSTTESYYCYKTENTKYSYILDSLKDSMDILSTGTGELVYESGSSSNIFSSAFIGSCEKVRNSYYCYNCTNSHDLFGCVSLNRKSYCVFNKQYEKAEYEKLVSEIVEAMQATPLRPPSAKATEAAQQGYEGQVSEWGEFFPVELSPFCFNESNAFEHFALDENKAKAIGASWQSIDYSTKYDGPFYQPKPISNYSVKGNLDANTEIEKCLAGVLKCEVTNRPFKIIAQELLFYIKEGIELPRKHPDLRHEERLTKFNKMNLYERSCMCDQLGHSHHGKCNNNFKTTFEPNRPEKVYCEACYQKTII